ncbi:MAG: SAM-dependent methyltransferase, partial [Promethearchaeota archaeon]
MTRINTDNREIVEYYDKTTTDYLEGWTNERDLALHYGYWDEKTRSRRDALVRENEIIASLIRLKPGMRVLDAGCGLGGTSIWLVKNFDVDVVGISLSEYQIKLARMYAKKQGLSGRVKFLMRDFTSTGFPASCFDAIIAIESYCHALDKEAFIAECFRLLGRPGQLFVADYF